MVDLREIITSRTQLEAYIASGEKSRADWRIGTEHEKFVFAHNDCRRAPYGGENGIGVLLKRMLTHGGKPILENNHLIGIKLSAGASITLEPGGQLELSGAPLENIHQTYHEIETHLEQLRPICQELNLTLIGIGHDPISKREEITWMPKGRYEIMREYMPKCGTMGIDMMTRTCTVQVNLDYESESDMREKMRISAALQPLATALFANSPIKEMNSSGYLSTRARCWQDTDPDRTGMPKMLFDDHFGYAQWVDYILSVPMYFLYQDGIYHNVAGADFRDFIAGKLAGFEGRFATIADFEDHLTVAFPEVRLKRFIEMRGADAGQWSDLFALPAFWVGLLYDQDSQAETYDLIAQFTALEIQELTLNAPKEALKARLGKHSLLTWAREILRISEDGLRRRRHLNQQGRDERIYLEPLQGIVATGETHAEDLLNNLEQARREGVFKTTRTCRWLINHLRSGKEA